MKSRAILMLVGLGTLAPASAVPNPFPTATRQTNGTSLVCLYVCTEISFGGRCDNFCDNSSVCFNPPNEWNNVVKSVIPQESSVGGCTLWRAPNCVGRVNLEGIHHPGLKDLGDFDGRVSSWRCY